MNTITLQKPGELAFSQASEPGKPGAEEALVRVHRVGVCGTDYHAFAGKQPYFSYPRILGHELGVEVLALDETLGNPQRVCIGDRCSVEPYVNCQQCIACRRGRPNCCTNMRVIGVHTDGGMRGAFILPLRKLHPANALSYDQIALVETLGIGAHAVERAQVQAEDTVLVIGAGPIGLSVIQFAAVKARTIVMDVAESRLAFCREKLGIAETIHVADGTAPAERLKALTQGDNATVVIDATGNAKSMCGALQYLAHGGRLVYVGLFPGEFSLSDPEFHKRETTLLGSRNALPEDFSRIIRMIEAKQIDTGPWITHRAKAEDLVEAFPTWTQPATGVLKAIIEF
ncbi:MAG TPA: zinc-binding alcohol dehydrogenase family protein [Phycisphaerae bacterium]|jgi:threonine dehydrogenase-like Zn-dependent dehydrogenase|nr:zinc-binding alcohol dehydrogenase family protein [Phycisphaerae bacterium]